MMKPPPMMTEAVAKELYTEELTDIYDIKDIRFGCSRIFARGGVLVEQKLNITIDEKGNKDAIEYLKGEGFTVEQRNKKGRYYSGIGVRGKWGNGEGYEITLSLQVTPQEDKKTNDRIQ